MMRAIHEANAMARLTIAVAAMAAGMSFDVPASYAFGDAPWCAVIGTDTEGVHMDCQYQTFAECAPHVVAGDRGFCNVNPWPGPSAPGTAVRLSHPRHHAARR
jgi:hypothetical protein